MDFLTDWLTNWLKELLIGGIMGNLEGLFDTVNTQVGEIAAQVGTTPAAWHAGVFSLIRQLSETVILPIAGMVLTFVATYELIQMLLEKNNMHEVDVANLYKWMFKTACAILTILPRQQGAALQKGAATEDRQEKTTAQAAASAKYREDGVPQQELERFARFLLPKIQAFYQSEEGQRLFEEWINRRNAEEKTGKCKGS